MNAQVRELKALLETLELADNMNASLNIALNVKEYINQHVIQTYKAQLDEFQQEETERAQREYDIKLSRSLLAQRQEQLVSVEHVLIE